MESPAQKMQKIEEFCRFILEQMINDGFHLAYAPWTPKQARIIPVGIGTTLTLPQILADNKYIDLLMGYTSQVYKDAAEEYADDATR